MSGTISADTHPLTWRACPTDEACDLKRYEAQDGYVAVQQVLKNYPDTPTAHLAAAKLTALNTP